MDVDDTEAVGNDDGTGPGPNSFIGPTAGEDSVIRSELTGATLAEKISETNSKPPPPDVDYSTDLSKELSLDVLLSLDDDTTPAQAEALEESIMDLASVGTDMEFISDLCPEMVKGLSLPMDHVDSTATEALSPSSAIPDLGPDTAADRPTSSSGPAETIHAFPENSSFGIGYSLETIQSASGDDSFPAEFAVTLTSPTTTAVESMPVTGAPEVADAGADLGTAVSPSFPAPSTQPFAVISSDNNFGFPSASMHGSSTSEDNSRVSDEIMELAIPNDQRGFPGLIFTDSPAILATDTTEVTTVPVDHASGSSSGSELEEDPVTYAHVDPAFDELNSVLPLHSPGKEVDPETHSAVTDPLQNLAQPYPGVPIPDAAVANSEPVSSAAIDPVLNFSPSSIAMDSMPWSPDLPFEDVQSSPSGDDSIIQSSLTYFEVPPLTIKTPLPVPTGLLTSGAASAALNGPFSSHFVPYDVSDAENGIAHDASSLRAQHPSSDIFLPASVPEPGSPGAAHFRAKANSSTVIGGLSTSSNSGSLEFNPLVAFRTEPSSLAESVIPLKAQVGDSILTSQIAGFWEAPSSPLSSGFPLSVYFNGSRSPFRGRKSARKKKVLDAVSDPKDRKGTELSDIEKFEDISELENMLEAQGKMIQWQIDEMQRIATLQTQLTGSNPLSDEVVWEVLGMAGGGRIFGDSLSPEVLRSLQDIFAIKDTLTKKEARDISSTLEISLTQVKDFFATQRAFVRKLVQQAHDEEGRLGTRNTSDQSQQVEVVNSIDEPIKDLGFERLTGIETVEKLLERMSVEKGFAEQVQLLQVILRTESATLILRRFLEKGGLKILGEWLVEAVAEQQTTLVCHLLKALDHLPVSSAVSHQMPSLVQSVNKLRFHSAAEGRARSLFTKWCKLFSPKTEGAKPLSSSGRKSLPGVVTPLGSLKRNRDPPGQMTTGPRKKKIGPEALQHEHKASPVGPPGSPHLNGVVNGMTENSQSGPPIAPSAQTATPRWSSTLQLSESAAAAVSVSRKRLATKSFNGNSKDRTGKVLPFEDKTPVGRIVGSKTLTTLKNSRPLSTDDIYKAKKLERLMQEPLAKARRKSTQDQDNSLNSIATASNSSKTLPSPDSDLSAITRKTTSGFRQSSPRGETAVTSSEVEPTPGRQMLEVDGHLQHESNKARSTPFSSQDLPKAQGTSFLGRASTELLGEAVDDRASALMAKMDVSSSERLNGAPMESLYSGASQGRPLQVSPSAAESLASDVDVNQYPSHSKDPHQEDRSTAKSEPAGVADTRLLSGSAGSLERSSGAFSGAVLSEISRSLVGRNGFGAENESSFGQKVGNRGGVSSFERDQALSDFYTSLRASMIRWRVPPEYYFDKDWNVALGEDSKEREIQSGRVKREEESYYPEFSAIPDDPKDPWEEEPNYDDSLTLEILIENDQQKNLPEINIQSDMPEPSVVQSGVSVSVASNVLSNPEQFSNDNAQQQPTSNFSKMSDANGVDVVLQQLSTASSSDVGTHDPELLALLLRNPDLVSRLTSGQAFSSTSGVANPGVFAQLPDALKEISSGNRGAGLGFPAGDLGHEKLISPPNNSSKAIGISPQPGRSVSSLNRTPSESIRAQDSRPITPRPGVGQQQTLGVGPQGGIDSRFLSQQIPSGVARSAQDPPSLERLRPLPPPPQVPPLIQTLRNQALPSQTNKLSNWPQSQGWAGAVRPPLNPPQTNSAQERLHVRPQQILTHNARLPSYNAIGVVPPMESGSATPAAPQFEGYQSQRSWSNGPRVAPVHDNSLMHGSQESVIRSNRWPQSPARPSEQHSRSAGRGFPDFSSNRVPNVLDSRPVWLPSEGPRPIVPQVYGPPQVPPFPSPLWQNETSSRAIHGGAIPHFPAGRDLRQSQPQLWHNNLGPGARQIWRGPQ